MKKKITLAFFSVMLLAAALVNGEPGMIVKKDGKSIPVDIADADATGNISYMDGKIQARIKSSDYLYARVSKTPAEITDAEKKAKAGKYDEALAAFAKLANSKYKHLGYDLDCLYWQAFCLDKLNKKDEAVNLLKKIEGYQLVDKAKTGIFFNCKKLLANIYIDQNKFDSAYPVLTELGESDDPNLAAYSFNARGEILKKQGKKKDAVLLYMRTALIFPPKNSERPESLINIATLLREMNDARAAKFEEILKKDYPDRAKDLK